VLIGAELTAEYCPDMSFVTDAISVAGDLVTQVIDARQRQPEKSQLIDSAPRLYALTRLGSRKIARSMHERAPRADDHPLGHSSPSPSAVTLIPFRNGFSRRPMAASASGCMTSLAAFFCRYLRLLRHM
jgi:hypothetical protein